MAKRKNRKNVNDTWKDVEVVRLDDEENVEVEKEEKPKMNRKKKIAIGTLIGVGAVGAAFLTGLVAGGKKNYAEDTANDDDDGINEFIDKDIESEEV
jgi:hypothetical protein